jgi:signal transduction histidine kinase
VPSGFIALVHAAVLGLLLAGLAFALFTAKAERTPGPIFAFGLLSAFLAVSIPFTLVYNDANDVETYVFAFSAHSLLTRGAFIAWIFYLHALTNFTLKWSPRFMYAFEAFRTVAMVTHLDTPYFMEIRGIERVAVLFGDTVTMAIAEPGPFHILSVIAPVLHGAYTVVALVALSKLGRRRIAILLGIPFLLALSLVFFDNVADSLQLSTIYISEFAFPLVIFALAASLMEWVLAGERARETVVEQEAQIVHVLDSIADGVVTCDRHGRIVRMNSLARALTDEVPEGTPRFVDCFRIQDPETLDEPSISSLIHRARDLLIHTGSEARLVHVTAGEVMGSSLEPVGYVIVMHDVTDRARRERVNRRSEKMRALGELAGGVAHDFNNYLAAIGASARMLERRGDDPSARALVSTRIAEAVAQASSLTRRLLDFSHESESADASLTTVVAVNDVVEGAADMIRSMVGSRIDVVVQLTARGDRIQGNAHDLQLALLNLGKNAADAIDDQGVIRIVTADVEDVDGAPGVSISVEDSGEGIAPQNVDRIFEPFFTTKPVGRGTGFGLPSVHRIVTDHGGTIEVESALGSGTTFTLTLPRLPTEDARERLRRSRRSKRTAPRRSDTARPS